MRVYYGWTTVAAAAAATVATETVAPYQWIVILKQLCAIRFYFDHQIRCERREKNKMRRKKTLTRLTLLFLSLISLIVAAAVVVVVLIVQTSATWLRIVVAITCLRVCVLCDERLTSSWGLQLFGSHVYDSLSCVLWLLIIFVINLSGPTQNIHWMARFRQFVCHHMCCVYAVLNDGAADIDLFLFFLFFFSLSLSPVVISSHHRASVIRATRGAQRSDGRGENA